MLNLNLIGVAHAAPEEAAPVLNTETGAEAAGAKPEAKGLEIQPTTIAWQALNFILLLAVLNLILYKPLVKLITDREKKIREGVANAEKAENMLKESNQVRQDMLKRAHNESQELMEKARKSAEEVKTGIMAEAQTEADKIIKNGHTLVESEKAKTMQELKASAVNAVVLAAEKLLREKIDPTKDAKMIEESLNSYSA